MWSRAHWKQNFVTGSFVAVVAMALWLLSPTLQQLGNVNLIIFFVVMLVVGGYLISFLHRRDRRDAPAESLDTEHACSPA